MPASPRRWRGDRRGRDASDRDRGRAAPRAGQLTGPKTANNNGEPTTAGGKRSAAGRPLSGEAHTAFSAVSRSSMISSGCSSPHDSRTSAVADAELGALLRLEPLMRRGRRMGDQALGVAEIVGDAHELERVLEAERRRSCRPRPRSATSVEPPRICFCTIVGLRMVRPARIDQPRRPSGCSASATATFAAVSVCRAHAHRERLQALEQHPGVERRHRRAGLADAACGCGR